MPQAADSCIDCGLRAVSGSQSLNAIADDYRTIQYIGQCLLPLSSGSDTPCGKPVRFSGYRKKTQQARWCVLKGAEDVLMKAERLTVTMLLQR
jgi:hypothetical protein